MRRVIKLETDKTVKLASQDTYDKLLDIATKINKDKISDTIYRDAYETPDGKGSHVEDKLAISYLNKCGYCERICKADIEHYRPKKKVKNETHEGYYWLCYEWTNLLPSCITCNRDGAKHTKFTVFGTRVKTPTFLSNGNLDLMANKSHNSPLIDEIPGLLHPEIDIPNDYLGFEVINISDGIRLKPKESTEDNSFIKDRAKETIRICKLNRQELRLDRLQLIHDLLDSVESSFSSQDDEVIVDDISKLLESLKLKSEKVRYTHTLLRKYIISDKDNFKAIVLPFCSNDKMKNILLVAYDIVFN